MNNFWSVQLKLLLMLRHVSNTAGRSARSTLSAGDFLARTKSRSHKFRLGEFFTIPSATLPFGFVMPTPYLWRWCGQCHTFHLYFPKHFRFRLGPPGSPLEFINQSPPGWIFQHMVSQLTGESTSPCVWADGRVLAPGCPMMCTCRHKYGGCISIVWEDGWRGCHLLCLSRFFMFILKD